jgi:DNA-binding NtrC family response regulator
MKGGRMKNILIVDDHADIRFLLTELLEIKGYHIEEASNGEEALTSLRDKSFDLVITDIYMPKMNGELLIQKAKKELPDLPFVIMTSVLFPELKAKWETLKPGAILSKPFTVKQLFTTVRDVLETGVWRDRALPACAN